MLIIQHWSILFDASIVFVNANKASFWIKSLPYNYDIADLTCFGKV